MFQSSFRMSFFEFFLDHPKLLHPVATVTKVQFVAATASAFAAVTARGLVTWGDPLRGGAPPSMTGTPVVEVAATRSAFAAILAVPGMVPVFSGWRTG